MKSDTKVADIIAYDAVGELLVIARRMRRVAYEMPWRKSDELHQIEDDLQDVISTVNQQISLLREMSGC